MPIKSEEHARPEDWIIERASAGNVDEYLDDDKRKTYSIAFISPSTSVTPRVRFFLDVCSFCNVDRVFELGAIERSSRQCRFCRFILQATNECLHPLAEVNRFRLNWAEGREVAYISAFSTPETSMEIYLEFASQIRTPSGIVGGSPTSMALVANWLKQCYGPDATPEHSDCPKIDSHSFTLPTRLLEISSHVQHLEVRLVDAQTITNPHQPHALLYTTLSHCWGPEGSPRLKTTPDNLQARKSGIPWDSIPRTFQDAMLFTHGLGVKFIWIDSCCIIQDEPDLADWRKEAMNMCDIYSGSYFTIMATNAANAGSGLFQTVAFYLNSRPTMPLRVPQGYDGDQVVLYTQRTLSFVNNSLGRQFPLMTRGWCFQERFLSPRVVSFMDNEIMWRCHSTEEAELSEFQYHSPHRYYDRTLKMQVHMGNARASIIWQWHRLVEEYCTLDLTYEEDRLPAIGGIATRMSINRHGGYFAGVWQDAALYDICWFRIGEQNPMNARARPKQRRGPSWSWASVEGRIAFSWNPAEEVVTFCAEVLDLNCDYIDPGKPFASEATGGVLKLRSRLLLCPVELWNLPYGNSWQLGDWYIHKDPDVSFIDASTLYLVQICRSVRGEYVRDVYLIVRHLGQADDVYERVGLADCVPMVVLTGRGRECPEFGSEQIITIN